MLSIPRDISNFPLYSGGTFRGKINSLMTAAGNDPKRISGRTGPDPDPRDRLSIGVPINYYAAINLDGFQKMVDLVGGVDIDNPRAINDPLYDWFDGTSGSRCRPDPITSMAGTALAYVRSRQGVGDSDFTRAARQQQVLVALRAKMGTAALLEKLPGAPRRSRPRPSGRTFRRQIREYLELANEVADTSIATPRPGTAVRVHPPTARPVGPTRSCSTSSGCRSSRSSCSGGQRLQERSPRVGTGGPEVTGGARWRARSAVTRAGAVQWGPVAAG